MAMEYVLTFTAHACISGCMWGLIAELRMIEALGTAVQWQFGTLAGKWIRKYWLRSSHHKLVQKLSGNSYWRHPRW